MNAAIVIGVILAFVAGCVSFAWTGFRAHERRTSRNAAGKEFALLADARAVELLARKLLAESWEDLVLHDAVTPWDRKKIGYGKGILTVRLAASQAIGAQRQLELAQDFDGANIRLRLAKRAFGLAEDIARSAKITASIGTRRPPDQVEAE